MLFSISSYAFALLSIINSASAHTVITYPGWRGDNLHANGTVEDTNGLGAGGSFQDGLLWPYGMQWSYPCGGMPTSTNRTKWPITGGAVAFQPGWFQGHSSAFIHINMGFGTIPPNMSNPILSGIELVGPTNEPYPGTWCFPQLPLPANKTVNVGDNATIQLIEVAKHGAALYNCVDITFEEPGHPDIPEVNASNCFNSSQLTYDLIFTTTSLKDEGESAGIRSAQALGWVATLIAIGVGAMSL